MVDHMPMFSDVNVWAVQLAMGCSFALGAVYLFYLRLGLPRHSLQPAGSMRMRRRLRAIWIVVALVYSPLAAMLAYEMVTRAHSVNANSFDKNTLVFALPSFALPLLVVHAAYSAVVCRRSGDK